MKTLEDYVTEYQLTLKARAEIIKLAQLESAEPYEDNRGSKPVPVEEFAAISSRQLEYDVKFAQINKYQTVVRITSGFFKGATGKVVRPYPNEYNYSVQVKLSKDSEMMAPVLMDVVDLEKVEDTFTLVE